MKFLGSTAVASASFIVVTVGCLVSQPVDSQPAPAQEQLVDAAGNMHIPNNYRTSRGGDRSQKHKTGDQNRSAHDTFPHQNLNIARAAVVNVEPILSQRAFQQLKVLGNNLAGANGGRGDA
jgi:hypothetical protein